MSSIDPEIKYVRCLQTDGHRWKLYEIHKTHVKKTKFFEPHPDSRFRNKNNKMKNCKTSRFFDDNEHMLSIIGLIRYAMGIRENIVLKSESYEVEELPASLDP